MPYLNKLEDEYAQMNINNNIVIEQNLKSGQYLYECINFEDLSSGSSEDEDML